ncbi:MAG: alpha/beta fold hydrolase [Marmoricola sp.]
MTNRPSGRSLTARDDRTSRSRLGQDGIGRSTGEATDGSTEAIAAVVHDLLGELALENVTLVGHDMGGMTAYSYLRRFEDAPRTVIMDTVVPGVAPWDQVLANPYVWHFAFHSIPGLPELLVQGKQREYFDFSFDVLSPEQSGVSSEARDGYASGVRR